MHSNVQNSTLVCSRALKVNGVGGVCANRTAFQFYVYTKYSASP